jgi:TolB-like protein/DNA-binding winged helix-turn-helix (wHTH) protein/Tfp pilus assembly protein PilF
LGIGMVNQPDSSCPVRFGDFQLDLRTAELRRGHTLIKLQPQPARLLVLLVRRAGETISRQELAEQVWGTETFVDFEQGLNFAIRQVRAALEDERDRPQFLETVPKRGYRFIAPVEHTSEGDAAVAAPTVSNEVLEDAKADEKRGGWQRRWRTLALACVLLLIGSAAVKYSVHEIASRKLKARSIQSIAVLPLASLSADPAQEYFSEGLTDEIITELARIGTFRVVSRTSVVKYKGTIKSAPVIGTELRVDAVVEGTVERGQDRVRIRAQLIRAATDQHLWAESYDREASDLLRLESDVARDIAQAIGHLSVVQRARAARTGVVSTAAHEDYLKGRYYWNKRTRAGLYKGIEFFNKAIGEDPNYALAHAGLADSHIILANWGIAPPGDEYRKAKVAAARALELDDQLAEAHTSLAYATLLYDWDWDRGEKGFRRAIALNPNYASAHQFYSILLMTSGRQAEALDEIRRAQELDPLSLIVNEVAGWIYYEGRHYDEAIKQYSKTLDMEPNYVPSLLDLGTAYMRLRDYGKAIAQFEKAREVSEDGGVVLSDLAQAYALSGDRAEAIRILRQLQQNSTSSFVSSWDLSLIYLALDDKSRAIALLKKAADEHVGWVVRLEIDPAFDSLRAEPEFKQLVRRIRIPRIS